MGDGSQGGLLDKPWELKRTRLQKQLEKRELKARSSSFSAKMVVVLAVVTLSLGLAVLALATNLRLNETAAPPPHLALSQDAGEGSIEVIQAEPSLRWSDLRLDGNCTLQLNGRPLSESPQAPVVAGDVLSCLPGETLQIFSTRERGGAILYDSTFAPPAGGVPGTPVPVPGSSSVPTLPVPR